MAVDFAICPGQPRGTVKKCADNASVHVTIPIHMLTGDGCFDDRVALTPLHKRKAKDVSETTQSFVLCLSIHVAHDARASPELILWAAP
jgi:hypothetical protein